MQWFDILDVLQERVAAASDVLVNRCLVVHQVPPRMFDDAQLEVDLK
jgi:hypothetical protein